MVMRFLQPFENCITYDSRKEPDLEDCPVTTYT